jgi:hypothetical protein
MDFTQLTDDTQALYEAHLGTTSRRAALQSLEEFWSADVIRAETKDGKFIGVFHGEERVIATIASKRAAKPKVMTICVSESGDYEDIECLTMLCETIKGSCTYP